MLYIVLALVVAAFGLLIAALTTANTLWAWISVVVSVVAAALLVTDWLSGRRAARAKDSAKPTVVTMGGRRDDLFDDGNGGNGGYDGYRGPDSPRKRDEPVADEVEFPSEPAMAAVVPESDAEVTSHIEPVGADTGSDSRPGPVDDSSEPDEEPTDASDLLVVAGLNVEVRVVDEHPRYHLATCTWLGPRRTIPVAVSEARQLGFTPCARCGPDAVLAARHRAAR